MMISMLTSVAISHNPVLHIMLMIKNKFWKFLHEFLTHSAFSSRHVCVIADSFLLVSHTAEAAVERNRRTCAHTLNLHRNRLPDQDVKTVFFGLNWKQQHKANQQHGRTVCSLLCYCLSWMGRLKEKYNINDSVISSDIKLSGFVCHIHCLATGSYSLFYYPCICGPGCLVIRISVRPRTERALRA